MAHHHKQAWEYMKQQPTFTVTEVAAAVGIDRELCRKSMSRLKKSGFIRIKSGIGVAGRPFVYCVVDGMGEPPLGRGSANTIRTARRSVTSQQLIWNALRINRQCVMSVIESVTNVPRLTIHRYLRELEKAGYVKCHRVNKHRPNEERVGDEGKWKLIRETGPKAPILRRDIGMWDQNEQQLYPFTQEGS